MVRFNHLNGLSGKHSKFFCLKKQKIRNHWTNFNAAHPLSIRLHPKRQFKCNSDNREAINSVYFILLLNALQTLEVISCVFIFHTIENVNTHLNLWMVDVMFYLMRKLSVFHHIIFNNLYMCDSCFFLCSNKIAQSNEIFTSACMMNYVKMAICSNCSYGYSNDSQWFWHIYLFRLYLQISLPPFEWAINSETNLVIHKITYLEGFSRIYVEVDTISGPEYTRNGWICYY